MIKQILFELKISPKDNLLSITDLYVSKLLPHCREILWITSIYVSYHKFFYYYFFNEDENKTETRCKVNFLKYVRIKSPLSIIFTTYYTTNYERIRIYFDIWETLNTRHNKNC